MNEITVNKYFVVVAIPILSKQYLTFSSYASLVVHTFLKNIILASLIHSRKVKTKTQ